MKALHFSLLLFACITITSCKVQPIVPTGVQDVQFGKIDMLKGLVDLDMGLKINNPNSFAVTVYGMDLDLNVAGVPLGNVAINDKFKIERKQEEVYRVKVNAKFAELISAIPKLLAAISKHETKVELKGNIRVGSGIFKHTFPINFTQDKVKTTQLQ